MCTNHQFQDQRELELRVLLVWVVVRPLASNGKPLVFAHLKSMLVNIEPPDIDARCILGYRSNIANFANPKYVMQIILMHLTIPAFQFW